tara:strand:- start:12 stop:1631 length:1620 start_codon:yes stop_codon:yes gene_type:complete
MAITRSQIARQLLSEGGVSLDDAKAMAPKGEFLAYINPKEAEMLKDAGGSGIMTPMGIPSFVDFGAGPGSVSESLSEAAGLSGPSGGGGGGNGDGGGNFSTITRGPKGPPTVGDGGSGQYITKDPYGKQVTNLGRRGTSFVAGLINPAIGYTVNQQLKEEQQKQKDLMNAIQGGQQFFGATPRSLTTAYKETTGMKTGPSGPPGGGGGDGPIIPKIPQVAQLPTDIETPASDSEKQFDVRFFLDPRFEAKDGGEVSVDDAEKMAPPGESLAYINDDEAALLKSLGGAGEVVNQTGIPSYFIKKVFKKAKKAVKKIVKSDLGKAALAGAAIYGLGGGAAFGGKGFAFGNLPGAGAVSNFFSGGGGNKLSLFNKAKSFLGDNAGAALGIGAASIAGGLMSGQQEEETDTIASRISKETGLPIAQIRKEVQEATAKGQGALDELSVKYPFLQRAETALVKDGGRINKAKGGIMNLGGMEMDLRGGGFVPLGAKEKADDVPARLSKNEFVFTADAVRAAGGGSVDKGADLMYKTMKQLEDRVA